MDFFDDIFKSVAQGKEFAEVFTPEIVDKLAELDEKGYDVFRVQLDAHLILNQAEMEGVKNLDKLVRAARARLEEKRSKLPPAPLKDQLPDAPENALFVPPGWLLAPDGVYRTDAEGVPKLRVCTAPVFASQKRLDPDRGKAHLVLSVKVGEWRATAVPSFSRKKALSAVADMGALVLDEKAFLRYWDDFLKTNWDALPVVEADCALYDELMAFVADNIDKVSDLGPWGKLVDGKEASYLALKPEVVRMFAKTAGVGYEHLLLSLREKDLLLSDGGSRLKTVWFNGRARRMVAVAWDKQAAERRSACGA